MLAHKRSMERGMEKKMGMTDPLKQPGGPEEGGDDGSQVAEEHGPATEVHVMHNHEAGEHHVTSMHPDGHQHESMHGSVEEAHEHGKKMAGAGMQDSQEQGEEPEYD
jgi:hypothetical protein